MDHATGHAKNLRENLCAGYTLERDFGVQSIGNKPSRLSGVQCDPGNPEHVLTLLLLTVGLKEV